METPAEQLSRYTEHADQRAFAAFVERFKGLVFSAAYRRLGSRQLAEDATQTVFAIAARKAKSLQRIEHHAPWLHRTATYVARGIARSEARHLRKMKALSEQPDSAAEWCAIHPHLDEALEKLPEGDRAILLLRFYDDLSYREIAPLVGKSEAAAQRQGHRALEKLAARLRCSGAASATAAIVSAGLLAQLTTPAPAAVATAALTNAALSAAPALPTFAVITNAIHTMSQTKTIAATAAVVALAAVPLGMQRAAIGSEKRAITTLISADQAVDSTLRASNDPLSALGSAKNRAKARTLDGSGPIQIGDWVDEFRAFSQGGDLDQIAGATAMLERLTRQPKAELERIIDDARQLELPNGEHYFLLQTLYERIAGIDPALALDSALQPIKGLEYERLGLVASALGVYAGNDPEGALAWYYDFDTNGLIGPEKGDRDGIHQRLFGKLLETEPGAAQRFFDSLSDRDQRLSLEREADKFHLHGESKCEQLVSFASDIRDPDQRRWAMGAFARNVGEQHGLTDTTAEAAVEFARAAGLEPEHAAHLIVASATAMLAKASGPDSSLDETLAWIQSHTPEPLHARNLGAALAVHAREGHLKLALSRVKTGIGNGTINQATLNTFVELGRLSAGQIEFLTSSSP